MVSLAALTLGLAVTGAALIGGPTAREQAARASFRQLRVGMTGEETDALFGRPADSALTPVGWRSVGRRAWFAGGYGFAVDFEPDGTVCEWEIQDYTMTARLRRLGNLLLGR